MARRKKLVDLVHVSENVNEGQLTADYKTRISSWEKWLDYRRNEEAESMSRYMRENSEYYAIEGWISMFLKKRLEWVLESVPDPELRLKYLLALPPFSQKGNIKQFLLHFFQLEDHAQQNKIVFSEYNPQEIELRILWDMYKITRTIETITTLRKWMAGRNRSSSQLGGKQAMETLENLQKSLTMVFQKCVKKEYQKLYLKEFPKSVFLPRSILERVETNRSLINAPILENLEYRNYLFFIYFKSKIRGDLDGQSREYEINYLDYELIRQEFLIQWITNRLQGSRKKQEVFERYMVGNKTFAQLTANRPDMEIKLLQRLPKSVFDDLIAETNEGLPADKQAPIDSMSGSFGAFAKEMMNFERAKKLAKKPVEFIRAFVAKTDPPKSPKPTRKPNKQQADQEKPKTPKKNSKEYKIRLVKKDQISFPFFCENNAHFIRLLKVFKMHLQHARYAELNEKLERFFDSAPAQIKIARGTPRREWSIPFVIHELQDSVLTGRLIIMGAELKAQPTRSSLIPHSFQSYFVYGAEKKFVDLGIITESRQVMGDRYFIYDPSHPKIISESLKLIDTIIQRKSELFTLSTITTRL